MTRDVNVHLINMDTAKKEAVVPNEDGSYSIFINARLSDAGRLLAYEHAMRHIEAEDFQKKSVQSIEADSHIKTCRNK